MPPPQEEWGFAFLTAVSTNHAASKQNQPLRKHANVLYPRAKLTAPYIYNEKKQADLLQAIFKAFCIGFARKNKQA